MNSILSLLGRAVLVTLALSLTGTVATAAEPLPSASHAVPERVILPDMVTPDQYRIEVAPDAAALTFSGRAEIDLVVHGITSSISLNSADLSIDEASLKDVQDVPAITFDEEKQRASFTFAHPLQPGAYTLVLRYRGKIHESASGMSHLDYETQRGKARTLYTQFENSDARRFVPCWDEPARKAVFLLTATVPAAQMAVSNMPVSQTEILPEGMKRVHFQATPKMSTYLLFLAVGDFERVHRDVGGVDVGVVVRRGETANAAYALDVAASVLPYYNDYFGTPYPLPKLDLVAGPGASQRFGAMENWGAIFYFERAMLIDPRISSEERRQQVFTVIAHEISHQWFGDLVTMAWWDDLWLNEGFASWMENKVAEHLHPEWNVWLQALGGKRYVMGVDARLGTHPVIAPISDVLQAETAFDAITYTKGEAVIRMLEAYLGEDAFRTGVRRYMQKYKYGNTVTDDLWNAMDEGSSRPVKDIAHDFTLQAGVPMVSVGPATCVAGHATISLTQGHFAVDADSTDATLWHVPVVIATLGGPEVKSVVAGAAPVAANLPGCAPAVVNAGQAGYFLSRYSESGLAELSAHYGRLPPGDQLGIFYDTGALAYASVLPMSSFLELTRSFPANADPVVLSALVWQLQVLDQYYEGLPAQVDFRAYARRVLSPLLQQLGWNKSVDESDNVAVLRTDLIVALGEMQDPAVVAEARTRFARSLADPASLNANLRLAVLRVVGTNADQATWAQLHALARKATSEVDRQELYDVLGMSRSADLAAKLLNLSLSGEPPPSEVPEMIEMTARLHPMLAFDFVEQHWAEVSVLLEPGSRVRYMPGLVNGATDARLAGRLDQFARGHIPESTRKDVRKAQASIRYVARIRETRLPEADIWLKHPPA